MDKVDTRDTARTGIMFDEMDRLRDVTELSALLAHYAELAAPDRQVWQDRVQELNGVEARELIKLHGELIAYGWLEQNTGATPILKRGFAPACYRITTAGLRALKQLRTEEAQAVRA
jgi:hypothetical protein